MQAWYERHAAPHLGREDGQQRAHVLLPEVGVGRAKQEKRVAGGVKVGDLPDRKGTACTGWERLFEEKRRGGGDWCALTCIYKVVYEWIWATSICRGERVAAGMYRYRVASPGTHLSLLSAGRGV
jgi:hypothetical protein